MGRKRVSEVHAYVHIHNELANKKGWTKGQIFTQQECLSIPAIAEAFVKNKPENVVKVSEKIYGSLVVSVAAPKYGGYNR